MVILGGLGVIAETSELHRKAYNMALRELDMPWQWEQEEYAKLLDIPGGKARLRAFLTQHNPGLLASVDTIHLLKTRFYQKLLTEQRCPVRTGLNELLARSRDAKSALAIASTTSTQNIVSTLDSAGIKPDLFRVIGGIEQVTSPKPSGEIYEYVLRQCKVGRAGCIAIEDSSSGVAAAKDAGLTCYALPGANTAHQDFSRADKIISDYGQVKIIKA